MKYSDKKLLEILENNNYLDEETQKDLLAVDDIAELQDIITEITEILKRRKLKKSNANKFLSDENEIILKDFLSELNEKFQDLIDEVKNSVKTVLD